MGETCEVMREDYPGDRGQPGMRDDELLMIAVTEEFVFVTNNHADFIGLSGNAELHTGLVILRFVRVPAVSRPGP
ncbi:MAG TPA: DUF5615 family PIN-like protein [Solirubrobacteraceae bacterium]|nr:DUF5615 family PIN-like protein [Solirubrobacteraceae bacterium]